MRLATRLKTTWTDAHGRALRIETKCSPFGVWNSWPKAQKGKRRSDCAGGELAGKSAAHAALPRLPAHEHLRAFIDYGASLEIVPLTTGGYLWDGGHGYQNAVVACRVRKTQNGQLENLRTRKQRCALVSRIYGGRSDNCPSVGLRAQ
jgi:hypothetical protein